MMVSERAPVQRVPNRPVVCETRRNITFGGKHFECVISQEKISLVSTLERTVLWEGTINEFSETPAILDDELREHMQRIIRLHNQSR